VGIYRQTSDIMFLVFGGTATIFWFLSFTFGHIKEVLYLIIQKDKKIKGLPKNVSSFVIKLSKFLKEIGLKKILEKDTTIARRFILKKKSPLVILYGKDPMRYPFSAKPPSRMKGLSKRILWRLNLILRKAIGCLYLSIYILVAAVLDLILNLNTINIVLIFFGISIPVYWVVRNRLNSFALSKS
jgi:hypothetical protein